jgi:uncharacterized protein
MPAYYRIRTAESRWRSSPRPPDAASPGPVLTLDGVTRPPTELSVRDAPERSRFEIGDGEVVAGFVRYERGGDRIAFTHTETAPEFEGQGVGSRLVSGALDAARDEGLAVLPFCPFVRGYIARHADSYVDLVPAEYRYQFGLPAEG